MIVQETYGKSIHCLRLPNHWLVILLAYHSAFAFIYGVQIMADSQDYIVAANDITAFIQSNHVIRTPGYPWFMSLLGNFYPLIICVQHGMAIALAWMFYTTLEQDMPRLAVVVFWVIGLHPWIAFWSCTIMTETLALFLLAASLLALIKQKPHLAGFLVGLSILVRPSSLGAIPALLLGVWLIHHELKKVIQATVLCTLVIFPWILRNHNNAGTWSLSSVAGHTLWSRQATVAGFHDSPWPEIGKVLKEKGELEGDRYFMRRAMQTMVEHPAGTVVQFIRSAKGYTAYDLHLLVPSAEKAWTDSIRKNQLPMVGLKIFFQYLLPCLVWTIAIYGLWQERHQILFQLSGLYLCGLSIVVLLIGIGDTRLRMPSEIFLLILSSAGVLQLLESFRAKITTLAFMHGRRFELPAFAFLDRFQNR